MRNVRKISKKYYLRQIVACLLVYFMLLGMPAQIALAGIGDGGYTKIAGDPTINAAGGTADADITLNDLQTIINWNNFDTIDTQTVQFLQTVGGNPAVLNRIIGEGMTQFDGSLLASGIDVFVVNTRGIIFGPDSFVQARNFIASGIDIRNSDFLGGIYQFEKFPATTEHPYSDVIGDVTIDWTDTPDITAGEINAENIALIGQNVTNKGIIKTTASGGAVVMAAGESVYLSEIGSNVAVEVAMTEPAEHIVDNGGELGTGAGTITANEGKVILAAGDIYSTAISGIESLRAEAKGDITLEGTISTTTGDITLAAGDDVDAQVLDAGGNVDISASDTTINLHDDVTAGIDIVLNNNTVADAGITLKAGQNVDIAAGKTVTALGSLGIEAIGGEIMADTSIIDMATDDQTLMLRQNANMDLEQDFSVNNRTNTDLVADSTGGSVTSDAAGEWKSITADASDNITLSDISEVITTGALEADIGDVKVTSIDGKVEVYGPVSAGQDVIITATDEGLDGTEDAISLYGGIEGGKSIVAGRDIWLNNNTLLAANYLLDAGQDVRIGWQGEQNPWDPTSGHYDPKTLTGAGALTVEADRDITLGGNVTVSTETSGDLILKADADTVNGDPEPEAGGDMTAYGTIDNLGGDIDIYAADSTIYLWDNVTALGDIILHNNTVVKAAGKKLESSGDDVVLAADKTLESDYDLTINAGDDILLGVTNVDQHWDSPENGSGGNVSANGDLTMNAGDSIYAHGTLTTTHVGPDDERGNIDLTAPGGINLYDDVSADVTDDGDIILHNNTWAADDVTLKAGRDVTVGDGTSDGTTLTGEGALTVEAGRHITLGGAVVASDTVTGDLILKADADTDTVGDMTAYGTITNTANGGGNIDIYSSDTTTYLHDDVTAGVDITLNNNTWAADGVKLDAGQDVTVGNGTADGTTLTGEGALTVEADRHITLGGAVVASDDVAGDLILKADAGSLGGDMTAHSTITNTANGGGSIDIYSSDTTTYLHDNVTAGVDLKLHNDAWAADGVTLDAGDDVEAFGTVTGEGDLTINAGTIESDSALDYANIRLHQTVTVEGSLVMTAGDDIEAAYTLMATGTNGAGNMILNAGDDIALDGTAVSAQSVGLMELIADLDPSNGTGNVDVAGSLEGNMKLSGTNVYVDGTVTSHGTLDVDADDDIVLQANVSSLGEMTMDAGSDIELNSSSGDTSSESTISLNAGDSVTIGKAFGDNGNVTANGSMGIFAGTDPEDNVKVFGKLTTTNSGNIDVTAGGDIKLYGSFVDSAYESAQADGDLTLDAEDDLVVLGDLISNNGSIELSSDNTTTYLGGDVTAAIDVTLNNNTKFYGFGDQKVDAQTGTITAEGWLRKASCWGSLYLEAAGDISLAGAVGADWGGVSIISEEGKIFTPGGNNDTLNVAIDGYSDQLEGDGVSLPYDPEKKAAIVIISKKEDLKLGPDSVLIANGYYIPLHVIDLEGITSFEELDNYFEGLYDEFGYVIDDLKYGFEDYLSDLEVGSEIYEDFPLYMELLGDYLGSFDDRPAIDFLAEPSTAIGGIIRDEGVPIDVAVYLQSETGDVDVESKQIIVNYNGTMVVDAYDTVRFGDLTSEPAIQTVESVEVPDGRSWVIDRLEVASRITEWLYEADAFGTLPYPYNPEIVEAFIGGEYLLRGAGLGNPAILDGRAWVLEDPPNPAPLYEEAGEAAEEEEFAEGGCPQLMNWLAIEIGIPAEDIQVTLAGALALNTDVQPCEMCARLKDAVTTMEDAEGARIASMARVVNEFVTTPAPPSPEQMTQIAAALSEHVGDGTYYALAGEWIDALVAYVGIMNTEMGYSASDSAAFAKKYLTPVTETGNAALIAYVQARLAALGG